MSQPRGAGRPPSHPAQRAAESRPPLPDPPRASPLQLAASAAVGIVLLGAGLYIWRRPRSTSAEDVPDAGATASAAPEGEAVVSDGGGAGQPYGGPLRLSEARIVGCHDLGPKKTPPDECDHPVAFEKAFARAVEQAATCVPPARSDATIEYIADVSFGHRFVRIDLPRAARSVRDRAVVDACAAAVRQGLPSSTLDGVDHQHARYKISMTATYRGGG